MNTPSEGDALLAAINENLKDLAPRLIYSDWLEENGRLNEVLVWRGQLARGQPIFECFGAECGSGDGSGDGYGDEAEYGFGNGTELGSGDGADYGTGAGDAYFDGIGDGSGSGSGSGEGYGYVKKQRTWISEHNKLPEEKPVIGKQMLIWCGRGFAWIGRVEEMYAPGCYKLSNAGMLCRTGSDSWMTVTSGTSRDNYVYRHAPDGIVYTGPELHGAVEWKGELPGQDLR